MIHGRDIRLALKRFRRASKGAKLSRARQIFFHGE